MSFLSERAARRFFLAAAFLCASMLVMAGVLSLFYASTLRDTLAAQELGFAASLLEQDVSPAVIANALRECRPSDAAASLLRQLGRTEQTPFWLLPSVRHSAVGFLCRAVVLLLLPAALLLGCAAGYLIRRDRLYRQATTTIMHYADGDFAQHLPRAETGALYHLFAAAEQLATALQAQNEAEHRAREFLKDTLSDISHQLKTPLASLRLYTEIIAAEPGSLETAQAFTEKSLVSLDRMEALIAALLKIARLDAGSISFTPETIRAQDLAQRAARELQTRAAREGKTLTLSGGPALTLRCDPAWTAEAVGNLIKNALDHTRPGDRISVCWEQSPAMLRLTVTDTGEGIAPDDLHHIFKRFYRSPHAGDSQGTGLGLPLARALIEAQGGLLSVQSTLGSGAVFTVDFLTKM